MVSLGTEGYEAGREINCENGKLIHPLTQTGGKYKKSGKPTKIKYTKKRKYNTKIKNKKKRSKRL
jgi:hypothetical protein